MSDLHLWHNDKNFTELIETKFPESSGVIYNLYEDCIVMREKIERLNARVEELESNNGKPFVIIDHQDNYSLWLVKKVDGLITPIGETGPIRIPSGWYAEITKDKYK